MTAQDKTLKENTVSSPLPIVAPGTCVEAGEQAKLVLGMYDHLVETVREYNPSADFPQIDKAFRYADTHHNGQLRKDGSPYITHPLEVAHLVADLGLDADSIIAALLHEALRSEGIDPAAFTLLPAGHEAAGALLNAVGYVDVVIPRGGAGLIRFVRENARIPVIETGAGIVHTYFDLSLIHI